MDNKKEMEIGTGEDDEQLMENPEDNNEEEQLDDLID